MIRDRDADPPRAGHRLRVQAVGQAVPILLVCDHPRDARVSPADWLADQCHDRQRTDSGLGVEERVTAYVPMLALAVLAVGLLRTQGTVAPRQLEKPTVTPQPLAR